MLDVLESYQASSSGLRLLCSRAPLGLHKWDETGIVPELATACLLEGIMDDRSFGQLNTVATLMTAASRRRMVEDAAC